MIRKLFSIPFLDMIPIVILSMIYLYWSWDFSFSIIQLIAVCVSLIGLIMWAIGVVTLGKNFHGYKEPKLLVTHGIYSKVQNPIYVGGILYFIGFSLFLLDPYIFALTISIVLLQLLRVSRERVECQKKFGKEYEDYLKGTWF